MPPITAPPRIIDSSSSSTNNNTHQTEEFVDAKPVNVFYVWYAELCRRQGTTPLNYVKPAKPKNECVLDFVCDRIKPEEWGPILNALKLDTSLHVIATRTRARCKFLHDVDTEDKAKNMKRRAGSIFTTFILQAFMKSLTNCIRRTNVLATLELDGVPLGIEEIACLVEALKPNTSIKMLVIKYCPIRDLGCQILCEALRQMPNIEVLDLSACGLGPVSAQNIAKIVKYQQINRYCESWHNSLRYEDPDVGIMAGLKRITLKNNPLIGDEGLTYILDELDDDLWIKAIDMQRCGITEKISKRLLDVIEYSRSLEVADFRCNENLSQRTLDQIIEMIKQKHGMGFDCEFKWCLTSTTLREGFTNSVASSAALYHPPAKSKSEPLDTRKLMISCNRSAPIELKRTKTCSSINRPPNMPQTMSSANRFRNNGAIQKSIMCLNNELQKETNKRLQSEIENRRLKHELHRIKSSSNFTNVTNNTMVSKEKVIKFDPVPSKKKSKVKSAMNVKTGKKSEKKIGRTAKDIRENIEIDSVSSNCTYKSATPSVEFVFENKNLANNILEKIIRGSENGGSSPSQTDEGNSEEDDEEKLMVNYFEDILYDKSVNNGKNEGADEQQDTYHAEDDGDSTASLLDFMREIKKSSNDAAAGETTGGNQMWAGPNFLQKVH